jgi:hypothetical protein
MAVNAFQPVEFGWVVLDPDVPNGVTRVYPLHGWVLQPSKGPQVEPLLYPYSQKQGTDFSPSAEAVWAPGLAAELRASYRNGRPAQRVMTLTDEQMRAYEL